MQLGFVLDQNRCIGCHACTVACKAENDVPVGSFRTWVKYTEEGEFPTVRRSFAVLRCNQCTNAPCVTICPTGALKKRDDGIVDVDPLSCIGCKSCMQGCPYDALYINPDKGTAEKCHFCAHRTERGLAPACAVVCPTEAIIPGDFDDSSSLVSRMKKELGLEARKTEAGTGPNVLYRGAAQGGIDPLATASPGGHIWADKHPGLPHEVLRYDAQQEPEENARARTTYDVAHPPLWGLKITGYLFAKAVASGVFLAACFGSPSVFGGGTSGSWILTAILGLLLLGATTWFLVTDLKRPERFFYILTRPNWSSWLVRGTWILIGFGAVLGLTLLQALFGTAPGPVVKVLGVAAALGSAGYTGWLFGQAKGRVLWMQRGLWLRLMAQALIGGAALLLLFSTVGFGIPDGVAHSLRSGLLFGLAVHLAFFVLEGNLAPARRGAEYARVLDLVKRGPYSREHWVGGVVLGTMLPIVLTVLVGTPLTDVLAAGLALAGLWIEKSILVRAGQALPIS